MSEARVRISLSTGELEVQGTEEFVAKYEDPFQGLLARLAQVQVPPVDSTVVDDGPKTRAAASPPLDGGEKREFGEALHSLPKGASGTDQILLAGYYIAHDSSEGTFSTADANKLLLEQGVKLSNPSQSLLNNSKAKRVFKVGRRFKLSKIGEEHVRSLMARG